MRFFKGLCDILGLLTIGYVVVSFAMAVFVSPSACVRYIVTLNNQSSLAYEGRLSLVDHPVWTGLLKPGESLQVRVREGGEGDFQFEAKSDDGREALSRRSRGAKWKSIREAKHREFIITGEGLQLVELSAAQLKAASKDELILKVDLYHCKNYDFWRSIF